jgi:sugar/nucleoside kinase (ribokinase family)
MNARASKHSFIGGVREDYCITHEGKTYLGVIGGNAVYSAVGGRLWSSPVRIVSRVGANYPEEWLADLHKHGIDVSGVKVLPQAFDTRTFYAYTSPNERTDTNPTFHFQKLGYPMPKELLDYRTSTEGQEDREAYPPLAVRGEDVQQIAKRTLAAHFAPGDFLTHLCVPRVFRQAGVRLITLDPSVRYMTPEFRDQLPVVLRDVDVFLPSDLEAQSFFSPPRQDTWKIADAFCAMGPSVVVIKRGTRGQYVLDARAGKRWMIPAYPARVRDVTGAGDSFCGGFLTGMHETGDPVEAALRGNVSASLTVEGHGALYALSSTPGLAEVRLNALREEVKRV